MTPTERKQRLFENIMRLRRAEREAPESHDIVAVRTDLERELGATVSRSLAARFLGLSHTALSRWIKRGDVPLVVTPEGRKAVPVSALEDLHDAVRQERESGRRRRHTLEPVLTQRRDRARRLDPRRLVSGDRDSGELSGAPSAANGHRVPELRSLAYHRALARRLRKEMVTDARHLVWQWREAGKLDPRYADQWEDVLRMPVRDIKRIIGEDSRFARDLRQSSPFAGLLSEPERRRILEEIR